MGSYQSLPSSQSCHLQYLSKVNLLHFGSVSIYYDHILSKQIFKKDYNFLLQLDSGKQFLQRIRNYNTNSIHLVQLCYLDQTVSSERFCSQVNKIVAYFQYLPHTARTLVNQRKSRPFPQPQLWKFLTDMLKAQLALNNNNNYHGDIWPQFVYYDESKDMLKLFDPVFFDVGKAGYHRAVDSPSYVSPQIMINLAQKRTYPQFNPFKADVFSIGMVLLYFTTLTDPIIAYNMEKHQIDFYHIENLIRIASKTYSQQLITLLRRILTEKTRPNAKQLLQELIPSPRGTHFLSEGSGRSSSTSGHDTFSNR